MTIGPKLPDGRRSLVLVSDNNFAASQFTQFLLFALELNGAPRARRSAEPAAYGQREVESDAGAILRHATIMKT